MGLLNITGTVTAHGQSQFDNHLTIYAYLEITESSDAGSRSIGSQFATILPHCFN